MHTPKNRYPDDTAKEYIHHTQTGSRYQIVAQALLDATGSLEGQRVLDLGCGTGIVTQMLANAVGESGEVVGVDGSADMLEQARTAVIGSNVSFIQSPAESVDRVVDGQFDAIFSSAAFWQFEREPTLRAIAKLLKPGGKLIFNLSGGFFDFKASDLWLDTDKREYTQQKVFATWSNLAKERYPDRVFPEKSTVGKVAPKQNLTEIRDQFASFGYTITYAEPLRFEIRKADEFAWLQIPQWTDRLLTPLTVAERVELLTEIFAEIPDGTTFLARWMVIVAEFRPLSK